MSPSLWISEADVVGLMSLPQAIDALRLGLAEEAGGRAVNMVKTHASWGGGSTLHAIGAVFEGQGIAGTKTWSHTLGGAAPLLILFDAANGSTLAIIEAFALGQMRTAGISGLATDVLARPGAKRLAMIGSGKQSLAQVAAVAAVRPLERVAVWSPTPAKREALAREIRDRIGIEAVAEPTLQKALADADVVTLATRAQTPFLAADALAPGVHINAIGAITPERAEFESALLARATVIAADSVPQARRLSQEFNQAFGEDEQAWMRLQPLSSLLAARFERPANADLTVFKAMGMGISDLSLGVVLLASAQNAERGRPLLPVVRLPPRLTETPKTASPSRGSSDVALSSR